MGNCFSDYLITPDVIDYLPFISVAKVCNRYDSIIRQI